MITTKKECASHSFKHYIPWFIASFFTCFQFLLQSSAGVMGPKWLQDFHLNEVGLSNLSAAFFYSYVLMQIPSGLLFDRYQPKYILIAAAAVVSFGCWLMAYTDHYVLALIGRFLAGGGCAFGFVSMLHITSTSFPANRFALMVGLSESVTMLGVMGGVILLAYIVDTLSWRVALVGSGVVAFSIVMASFWFIVPEKKALTTDNLLSLKVVAKQLKTIITDSQVLLPSIYGFFIFAIVNAFTSLWGISFLIDTYSFSQQLAANAVSMVFLGIAIGGPLSGWLSKILNQHRIILIFSALCATITMSIIVFMPHLPQIFLFIFLLLMGVFCAVYVQCFAVIKDSVSLEIRATALATSNMIIMLGAPVLQVLIGVSLHSHFFNMTQNPIVVDRLSLGILPAGMFIAFLLAFWIRDLEQ